MGSKAREKRSPTDEQPEAWHRAASVAGQRRMAVHKLESAARQESYPDAWFNGGFSSARAISLLSQE